MLLSAADAPAGPAVGDRRLAGLLLGGGLIGLVAAFVLTLEKLALLRDADHVPSCSINPVLNCGSVMRSDQAELFGFPNSLLGIVGFTVVAATGAALLAGARLARPYWLGLLAGTAAGAVFVHWLIFQSLYRIGALCPYCMVVWAVTIPLFWYVALRTVRLPDVLQRNHTVVLTLWFIAVATLAAARFWEQWMVLLGR